MPEGGGPDGHAHSPETSDAADLSSRRPQMSLSAKSSTPDSERESERESLQVSQQPRHEGTPSNRSPLRPRGGTELGSTPMDLIPDAYRPEITGRQEGYPHRQIPAPSQAPNLSVGTSVSSH